MVLKLFSTIGVPGRFSGKMYSIEGLRYWPVVIPFAARSGAAAVQAPWRTARTSRGGGRKVLAWFITHCLSGLAGTVPNAAQGGRKRQRPFTAPAGGPGSGRMVP